MLYLVEEEWSNVWDGESRTSSLGLFTTHEMAKRVVEHHYNNCTPQWEGGQARVAPTLKWDEDGFYAEGSGCPYPGGSHGDSYRYQYWITQEEVDSYFVDDV